MNHEENILPPPETVSHPSPTRRRNLGNSNCTGMQKIQKLFLDIDNYVYYLMR